MKTKALPYIGFKDEEKTPLSIPCFKDLLDISPSNINSEKEESVLDDESDPYDEYITEKLDERKDELAIRIYQERQKKRLEESRNKGFGNTVNEILKDFSLRKLRKILKDVTVDDIQIFGEIKLKKSEDGKELIVPYKIGKDPKRENLGYTTIFVSPKRGVYSRDHRGILSDKTILENLLYEVDQRFKLLTYLAEKGIESYEWLDDYANEFYFRYQDTLNENGECVNPERAIKYLGFIIKCFDIAERRAILDITKKYQTP